MRIVDRLHRGLQGELKKRKTDFALRISNELDYPAYKIWYEELSHYFDFDFSDKIEIISDANENTRNKLKASFFRNRFLTIFGLELKNKINLNDF